MGKLFQALQKAEGSKDKSAGNDPAGTYDPDKILSAAENKAKEAAADSSPKGAKPVDKHLVTLYRPDSPEAERFRSLRTKLLFPEKGVPPRSILVTSTIPEEGKTFVSANLAVSIAQNVNEHVLLMDCDIRKPEIHKYFGLKNVPGLSEHLSRGVPIEDLLIRPGLDKLTILAGGSAPKNPSELLSSTQMGALLEEVKNRYGDRYVVIDSPPPAYAPETRALIQHADSILLVVKCGGPRREMVQETVNSIPKEKLLGTFFNRFDAPFLSYYGYKKYDYRYRSKKA